MQSVHMEDDNLFILYSQYHGCWCSGDARSQGISRHGSVLVLPEYYDLSTRWVDRICIYDAIFSRCPYCVMRGQKWIDILLQFSDFSATLCNGFTFTERWQRFWRSFNTEARSYKGIIVVWRDVTYLILLICFFTLIWMTGWRNG